MQCPKKIYKWPIKHMKQCSVSLGISKMKIKPQKDSTLHPLGWLQSKTRNIVSVVRMWRNLYILDGTVK